MDWNAVGHAALDAAGMFFDGADIINTIWYACEGNMEMAAASAICALPGIGMAQTGFTNFLNGLEAGTFDAGAFLQTLGGYRDSGAVGEEHGAFGERTADIYGNL